jgi:molecular chaperone HtpG
MPNNMRDDYNEEILSHLSKSAIYSRLIEKCKEKDQEAVSIVTSGVSFAYQKSKTVIKHMGEFTLHDGEHLFRVLYLMELLLTNKNIEELSIPELMLLILSAFFHDIGMAPSEKEVINWKKLWDTNEPEFESENEQSSFQRFKQFILAQSEQYEEVVEVISKGEFSKAEILKGYLITEYIRKSHAVRARTIIDQEKILGDNRSNKIMFRDNDLTVELANICHSHNEEAMKLLQYDKRLLCGRDTYACLPLIGVVLRLADILDFDAKRTPSVLYSHLNIKNPISLKEWEKHRSIESWEITPERIQFNAKCDHPAIEASIREFCDIIDYELNVCNNILGVLNDFNKAIGRNLQIKVPFTVIREHIGPNRDIYNKPFYIYKETKFTLSKNQVIDLLMGTKLYGNSEVALRELLQNSIDACLLRAAQEKQWGNNYEPLIIIKYFSEGENQVLEIEDNGTGMDQYIIDKYYTKVGSSFYKSVDFNQIKIEINAELNPISRFGIGILSTFMIADILIVDTMRIYGPQKSSDAINLTVEGQDSIFWIRPGKRLSVGTTTKLILRKTKNPWEKMTDIDFIKAIESVIPNPPFKIQIETNSQKSTRDQNSFQTINLNFEGSRTWKKNDNIRNVEFSFENGGILGSCNVMILENQKTPCNSLETKVKNIEFDGETFPLHKNFEMNENQILVRSTTIGTDAAGNFKTDTSIEWLAESKSKISFHGIEIPSDLFPNSWQTKRNQVKISWPFPIKLLVDIGGQNDLDINSARTEILRGEKWAKIEEELAFIVLTGIAKSTDGDYWKSFKENIIFRSKNDLLIKAADRVKYETINTLSTYVITPIVKSETDMQAINELFNDDLPF